jgi:hypothetical protein
MCEYVNAQQVDCSSGGGGIQLTTLDITWQIGRGNYSTFADGFVGVNWRGSGHRQQAEQLR